jgi:hypothetical protein
MRAVWESEPCSVEAVYHLFDCALRETLIGVTASPSETRRFDASIEPSVAAGRLVSNQSGRGHLRHH